MNTKDIYKKLIEDFMDKYLTEEKKAIVFFQGFPGVFYKALREMEFSSLSDYDLHNKSGYCDYKKIDGSKELQSLLTSNGICWAYYEELLSITEILNDINVYNGDIFVVKNNIFSVYFPIEVSESIEMAVKVFDDDNPNYDSEKITKFYSDVKIDNDIAFFSYINRHYEIDLNKQIVEINFFNQDFSSIKKDDSFNKLSLYDLEFTKQRLMSGFLEDISFLVQSLNDVELEENMRLLNGLGKHFNVFFLQETFSRKISKEISNRHLKLFKKYWGEGASFRNIQIYEDPAANNKSVDVSQGALISNIIEQSESALGMDDYSDIIITAPTGSGKSLFFQVPAIYLHQKYNAVTLVVTPLIALMNDQVNEIKERGIECATFINSEITYEERQERLEGIKFGKYSIIYLSPELLLAHDIRSIVGEKKIGLFVIDEAHLVTSWGRDFRVDYWFLGDYIEKARKGSYSIKNVDSINFPVLCLTATAVFGGRDDVIGDLQNSLHLSCSSENLFIGYVRRDSDENSIGFIINTVGTKKSNTRKEEKIDLTCNRICEFIDNNQKTIIYFPYVSQIEDVYKKIIEQYSEYQLYVERYSGSGMDKYEKNDSYNRFKESKLSIMLATKAFGMGINIPDVKIVYHFAPTGTLADYVQEIGRAARRLPKGYAVTDYLKNDMNYATILWGLSGLRHYQIKAIMKKLYDLYFTRKSRNLLISPDVFGYLFDANNIDNKVKSGLMLLSSDLLEKYHFRVINVRAKNIFSIHYINIPHDVEKIFLTQYDRYCKQMTDDKPRVKTGFGSNEDMIIKNTGNIYEVDLSKVWENEFNDMTFAKFKFHFFSGELFSFEAEKITPRIKLIIHYGKLFEDAKIKLFEIVSAVQKTFKCLYRLKGGKDFAFEEFRKIFNENYMMKIRKEYIAILLDLFSYEGVYFEDIPTEQWKFIERKRNTDDGALYSENKYCIRTNKHSFIEQNIKRYFGDCAPNSNSGEDYITYLSIPKNGGKYSEYQLVASLLEMFNLATYELLGGRNPQIFVRINDPLKLKRIAASDKEYRNSLLTEIENRHRRSAKIVDKFMTIDKTNNERWSIIENYFLGYDGVVDSELNIND